MGRGRSGRLPPISTGTASPNARKESSQSQRQLRHEDFAHWEEAMPDKGESYVEWRDRFSKFAESYQTGLTERDFDAMYKSWEPGDPHPYGYIKTGNSWRINETLYKPENAGKTDEEMFTERDKNGVLRDLQTVRTLDRAISGHTTQKDMFFTRYSGVNSVKAEFGLTDAQIGMLANARTMNQAELSTLNNALRGRTSMSRSYTSASSNRKWNVFTDKIFERRLYTPAGTQLYVAQRNPRESEAVYGRNLNTQLMGVSISPDGRHVILHEYVTGYKKR